MSARWYMVNSIGMATLCVDEFDARRETANAEQLYPLYRPHRAVQLIEADEACIDLIEYGKACEQVERDKWHDALSHIAKRRMGAEQMREAVLGVIRARINQ